MRLRRLVLASAFVMAGNSCGTSAESPSSSAFPDTPYASFAADQPGLLVDLYTAPTQPPERGIVDAQLRVRSADLAPRDGLSIDVVPWMTSHGHGASVVPEVVALGGGLYRIDHMQLAMPGAWELRFTFHEGSAETHATQTLDVR